MYAYKAVERALGSMHEVDEASASAFRGRIQHLQKVGMVPSSPGRGKRIEYSYEDAAMWAFALQLGEFGIDPTSIKKLVNRSWSTVYPAFMRGNHGQLDFFVATPAAISKRGHWDLFDFWMKPARYVWLNPENLDRAIIINLTRVSRRLRESLGVDANVDLPGSEYEKNQIVVVGEVLKGMGWSVDD